MFDREYADRVDNVEDKVATFKAALKKTQAIYASKRVNFDASQEEDFLKWRQETYDQWEALHVEKEDIDSKLMSKEAIASREALHTEIDEFYQQYYPPSRNIGAIGADVVLSGREGSMYCDLKVFIEANEVNTAHRDNTYLPGLVNLLVPMILQQSLLARLQSDLVSNSKQWLDYAGKAHSVLGQTAGTDVPVIAGTDVPIMSPERFEVVKSVVPLGDFSAKAMHVLARNKHKLSEIETCYHSLGEHVISLRSWLLGYYEASQTKAPRSFHILQHDMFEGFCKLDPKIKMQLHAKAVKVKGTKIYTCQDKKYENRVFAVKRDKPTCEYEMLAVGADTQKTNFGGLDRAGRTLAEVSQEMHSRFLSTINVPSDKVEFHGTLSHMAHSMWQKRKEQDPVGAIVQGTRDIIGFIYQGQGKYRKKYHELKKCSSMKVPKGLRAKDSGRLNMVAKQWKSLKGELANLETIAELKSSGLFDTSKWIGESPELAFPLHAYEAALYALSTDTEKTEREELLDYENELSFLLDYGRTQEPDGVFPNPYGNSVTVVTTRMAGTDIPWNPNKPDPELETNRKSVLNQRGLMQKKEGNGHIYTMVKAGIDFPQKNSFMNKRTRQHNAGGSTQRARQKTGMTHDQLKQQAGLANRIRKVEVGELPAITRPELLSPGRFTY